MKYTKEELLRQANQGLAQAQFVLGNNLYYGSEGFEMDRAEAVNWFKLAAAQNHIHAIYMLGESYESGQVLERNIIEAIKCFYTGAMLGDKTHSLYSLLGYYLKGRVPAEFHSKCMECFLKYSDSNWVREKLAEIYENGIGVPVNYAEAIKWYRQASDNGRVDATYKLGLCYEEGRGVEKDIEEAVRLYTIAAEKNLKEAKLKLGLAFDTSSIPSNLSNHDLMRRGDDYFYGRRGLPQDYLEAIKYYYKAAENSDIVAENDLGNCFAQGKGCPVNHTEAVYWYQQAVKHGYMYAQYNLAWAYEHGEGIEKNLEEAAKLYRMAADQGHMQAEKRLEFLKI